MCVREWASATLGKVHFVRSLLLGASNLSPFPFFPLSWAPYLEHIVPSPLPIQILPFLRSYFSCLFSPFPFRFLVFPFWAAIPKGKGLPLLLLYLILALSSPQSSPWTDTPLHQVSFSHAYTSNVSSSFLR